MDVHETWNVTETEEEKLRILKKTAIMKSFSTIVEKLHSLKAFLIVSTKLFDFLKFISEISKA